MPLTTNTIQFFGFSGEPWPRNSAKCDVTSQAFTDCLGSFDSSCAHGVGVDSPFKIPDQAITTNAPPPEKHDWAVPSLARLGNTGKCWVAATDSPADYVQVATTASTPMCLCVVPLCYSPFCEITPMPAKCDMCVCVCAVRPRRVAHHRCDEGTGCRSQPLWTVAGTRKQVPF